jgi:predicted metalloprotease
MKISLPGRRSDNLRDQRGGGGRGGLSLPVGLGAGLGLPGAVIAIILLLLAGGNPLGGGGSAFPIDDPFSNFPGAPTEGEPIPREVDPDADVVDFVSFVLDDVQAAWTEMFATSGQTYEETELVLFTDAVSSGCGPASAATGPFYCPADRTVYLDLAFFRELSMRFDAPGDFAQAYVIAHEIAHHVQTLTGVSAEVREAAQDDPDEANELSVRQELQADCLAGVWGYTAARRGLLEPGDLEEGLTAAAAVGDDRIQREATGRVNPETWTHGSSEQRTEWFRRGFDTGDPAECDTFD